MYENGQFRGAVHYRLNVYQPYDEGRSQAVTGVQHIEGRLTPIGTIDLLDLELAGNRDIPRRGEDRLRVS